MVMSGEGRRLYPADPIYRTEETPLSPTDVEYIRSRCLTDRSDECVEGLIDWIRECGCHFRFKEPLDCRFEKAQDHAINCLEIPDPGERRRYPVWLEQCLKFHDVLALHFLQNALNEEPDTPDPERPKERSVYQALARKRGQESDRSLRELAETLHALYDKRSKEAAHDQFVNKNGKRDFRRKGAKEHRKMFIEARSLFAKAGSILVEQYRCAFPEQQQKPNP
jgi:hypothetical protein